MNQSFGGGRYAAPMARYVFEAYFEKHPEYFAEIDERGEVEGELNGRIVDTYEAARAAELLEWSELCAQKDAHKAKAQARTRALEA